MTAIDRLKSALVALAADGGSVPCGEYGGHELWTSDHAKDRALTVERCQVCPTLAACAAAADEAGEQWHVWGGRDRTKKPQRKSRGR